MTVLSIDILSKVFIFTTMVYSIDAKKKKFI